MASAMYAYVLTADGRWLSVRIRHNGMSAGFINGSFKSKSKADGNARRDLGPLQ